MGVVVIAAYRPKAGKEADLMALMRDHVPILRAQSLATDRVPILMRAKDGTVLEVFEWVSTEAIQSAHHNPVVQAMWARYNEACSYQPVAALAECQQLFASFEPVS